MEIGKVTKFGVKYTPNLLDTKATNNLCVVIGFLSKPLMPLFVLSIRFTFEPSFLLQYSLIIIMLIFRTYFFEIYLNCQLSTKNNFRWYHGVMSRSEAEQVLKTHSEGSYLLRATLDHGKPEYSLAIK